MPVRGRLLFSLLLFISVIFLATKAQLQIPFFQQHILTEYPIQLVGTHEPPQASIPTPASGYTETRPSPHHDNMDHNSGYRSVLYFVNWAIYGRKHFPWELPVDKLTHVLYAFANVRPDSGEVYLTDTWADRDIHWADRGDKWEEEGHNLYGCLKQLNILKRQNRHLKILLSIGGWTYSSNFKGGAGSAANRANFAASAVSLIKNYGFDGLDVDWEYPQNAQEAANWVALLQACRRAMNTYAATLPAPDTNYHFELTVASPAGPQIYEKLDLVGMDQYLDFWNLMAYDYAGSWDSVVGHQSNLYPSKNNSAATPFSTARVLEHYTRFIKPSKIVIGMPLFGRAFENTNGLGRPYSGIGQGSWEAGVYDFKVLPLEGGREFYDHESGASYSYDEAKKMLVSYDTVLLAQEKAGFIKNHTLGGAMWWESSGDRKVGEGSLIEGVINTFGGSASLKKGTNCLTYPESEWGNLRSGQF